MSASFEYKCRRCGRIEENPHASNELCERGLIGVVTNEGKPYAMPGGVISMVTTHSCKDGGMGVADLIGISRERVKEE